MPSQGYYDWVRAGRPYTLARPARALRDRLRWYGYTVYDYPNDAHQEAVPPQDHCPFSATGWPGTSPRWFGMADDVMPSPRPELPNWRDIADQIYLDRQAGVEGIMWLKYMNRELPNTSTCVQDRWTPNHTRQASGDRGHIHLSCRSDFHLSAIGDDYDPVARYRARISGGVTPPPTRRVKTMFLSMDEKGVVYGSDDDLTFRHVVAPSVNAREIQHDLPWLINLGVTSVWSSPDRAEVLNVKTASGMVISVYRATGDLFGELMEGGQSLAAITAAVKAVVEDAVEIEVDGEDVANRVIAKLGQKLTGVVTPGAS